MLHIVSVDKHTVAYMLVCFNLNTNALPNGSQGKNEKLQLLKKQEMNR